LWHIIDCIRDGRPPVCGIEATAAQTACIAASQLSMPRVERFDPDRVRTDETATGLTYWVPQLAEELTECYRTMQLPSERGLNWARPGKPVATEPFAIAEASEAMTRPDRATARHASPVRAARPV
jgi:hypothetical protein